MTDPIITYGTIKTAQLQPMEQHSSASSSAQSLGKQFRMNFLFGWQARHDEAGEAFGRQRPAASQMKQCHKTVNNSQHTVSRFITSTTDIPLWQPPAELTTSKIKSDTWSTNICTANNWHCQTLTLSTISTPAIWKPNPTHSKTNQLRSHDPLASWLGDWNEIFNSPL